MAQSLIASVESDPGPQRGQKHRSSGNFSTDNVPDGTNGLLWKVVPDNSGVDPNAISFDVMEDVSVGHDPTWWSGVKNNQQTSYKSSRHIYIANSSGASGSDFKVLVYAVTP